MGLFPVYAGEVSGPELWMKISAYDENGNPVVDREGELVCEAPSPSMPLYFWKDPENERYREAYFNYYQQAEKNVWRHGENHEFEMSVICRYLWLKTKTQIACFTRIRIRG
jgi:acyl-coenzyme A synthetase/AMP-(fatty) acid ligase